MKYRALAAAQGPSGIRLLPFALFLAILPFPGTVAFRLLCLVAAAAIAAFGRPVKDNPVIPCKWALAFWIAMAAISVAYSRVPGYSFNEFKNEIGYTMLAFASFLAIARDGETVERLLGALAAGFAVIGLWAGVAWFANGFVWNESGHYGGVAVFATYIVTTAPAFLWLAYAARRPWLRHAAWGLAAASFLLALATLQRAIWPALLVQAAVVGLWRLNRGPRRRRGLIAAAAVVLVIAASFAATSAWRSDTLGDSVEQSLTGDTRLAFWHGVVDEIAAHPWVGAGFGRGTMVRVYPQLVPADNSLLSHPHNVFLNYGIGAGIPGILSLAALFVCLGRRFWRLAGSEREDLAICGVCGLALVVGVVMRNQFNDLFIRDQSLLFWALAAIFVGQAARLQEAS